MSAASRTCLAFGAFVIVAAPICAGAQETLEIPFVYLEKRVEHPPTLSNFDGIPEDRGLVGAELAIKDSNTTGKFLKHAYALTAQVVEPGEDIIAPAREALDGGARIAIVNAPMADLLAIADLPEAADDLILNAGASDVSLRGADCRANVRHTIVSRDMQTDALMQFLVKRQWTDAMLVFGNYETDKALAEAYRVSARKFGVKIVEDKQWLEDADIRRNALQEVPVFTQSSDYDVLIVADEEDQFGAFFPFSTWLPRPVMGSAGLMNPGWSPVMEQWAAIQLQNRFQKFAKRKMDSWDYAAWLAVRAVAEAVTRTGKADVESLRGYLFSDAFTLDGFKGSRLSFRRWNGQLRQPVPLATDRALVTLAPIEGFLHQRTELDTLGLDEPEAKCTAFKG